MNSAALVLTSCPDDHVNVTQNGRRSRDEGNASRWKRISLNEVLYQLFPLQSTAKNWLSKNVCRAKMLKFCRILHNSGAELYFQSHESNRVTSPSSQCEVRVI